MTIIKHFSIKQRVIVLSSVAIGFFLLNTTINLFIAGRVKDYMNENAALNASNEAFLEGMMLEQRFLRTNNFSDVQNIVGYWETAQNALAPLGQNLQPVVSLIRQAEATLQQLAEKRKELTQKISALNEKYAAWRNESRHLIALVDEQIGLKMMAAETPEPTLPDIKHTGSTMIGLWSEFVFILHQHLLLEGDEETWKKEYALIRTEIQQAEKNLDSLIAVTTGVDLKPTFAVFETFLQDALQLSEEIRKLWSEAQGLSGKLDQVRETALTAVQTKEGEYETRMNALHNWAIQSSVAVSVGIMIILGFISLSITVSITGRLTNMMSHVGHLARLDLTKEFDVHHIHTELDALAIHLNKMIHAFRNVVGQVQQSGIQVTSSSTELAATAKQQEVTMKHQVDSTNKVVESVQEISELTTELVSTVQQVASMSQETAQFASQGQVDLGRMGEAMRQMEEASKSISRKLERIHEKADNITNVVTTITKVADQTNLLSLNAAIEAEKAGEYGRGFTVVAREIRRLADQTAIATLDIAQMVQEMQTAVSAGVMEMDKFIVEVRHSAEDVEKISRHLSRIIEQVQGVSPQFEHVNIAVGQQSEHTQAITYSMMVLSEEMRQTRDSLHETYSAIEQLNEAARGLQEQVSQFKVT